MKLPQDATKVFGGILFDIYQWQQEQFDGSTKTFECAVRGDVVKSIPIIGDTILISRDEQPGLTGCYDLFGGFVEIGESNEEAIKRETEEESWYIFEDYKPLRYSPYGMKIVWGKQYYIAKNCTWTTPQHLDSGWERVTIHQVNFDRRLEIITSNEFCKPDFAWHITQNYILPNKLDELKQVLFS